jgi:hypothetical protein
MDAVSIYRALLIVRGSWTVLEWLFDWGPKRLDSFTLLHPYASLFAHAIAVAFLLVILTGLWFFCRWARFLFVLLLAVAVLTAPFRAHHFISAPSSSFATVSLLMLVLTGLIITMSFLPPIRDRFAAQT